MVLLYEIMFLVLVVSTARALRTCAHPNMSEGGLVIIYKYIYIYIIVVTVVLPSLALGRFGAHDALFHLVYRSEAAVVERLALALTVEKLGVSLCREEVWHSLCP